MKKKIILIHGKPGSGKSSTADIVADRLGYKRFSGGSFFRAEAESRGVSFKELHRMIKEDYSVDISLDKKQKEFLENNEEIVGDSRLGFFFQPNAFAVFLDLDKETAAKRILKDMQENPERKSETVESYEEVLKNFTEREEKNAERYKDLYGIDDHFDKKHFNVVIDTKENSIEQVASIIIQEYEQWLKKDS
jgi:cytidylate kinase